MNGNQSKQMQSAKLAVASRAQAIEINGVLRNTYLLLSGQIGFCAVCAAVAIAARVPFMGFLPYLIGFFGISWIVHRTARSVWGLFWSFVFAAFIGVAIAPILAFYLNVNPMIVVQALALTASTFVGLSMYTIVRRTDFSWLGQFLTVAFFVFIGLVVLWFFVDLTPFSLIISGFFVFVACALILFQTSRVVLGGERNYIVAAIGLFVGIYLLFMNLLSIIGLFSGDE